MKRLLILVAMLLGGIAALSAQQPTQGQMLEDVIYLNDDTVLRGIIVEQGTPDHVFRESGNERLAQFLSRFSKA